MSKNNNDNQNNRNEYFEDRAGTNDARYHVVPHDADWAVKEEGKDEPVYTADSKTDAVKEAKRMAEESNSMAYVHSEHGQIEEQFNYMDE